MGRLAGSAVSEKALEMLAAELRRHVDDCMVHRRAEATAAEVSRASMKKEILDQFQMRHLENVERLNDQDKALAAIHDLIFRAACFAMGLLGAGLLIMILDKLGWVPLH